MRKNLFGMVLVVYAASTLLFAIVLPQFAPASQNSSALDFTLTAEDLAALDQQVQEELEEAIRFADESPFPTVDAVVQDVYSDIVEEVRAR
jgi:hypothetical protein